MVEHLEQNRECWTVDETLSVTPELDAIRCLDNDLACYVVPGMIDFNIGGSPKRKRIVSVSGVLFCSFIVATRMESISDDDGICSWEEAKVLTDTRQRAEEEIIFKFCPPGLNLISVEALPPEDIEVDHRNYLTQTTFGYEIQLCGTQHGLQHSSTESTVGTRQVETEVSHRQRR